MMTRVLLRSNTLIWSAERLEGRIKRAFMAAPLLGDADDNTRYDRDTSMS